MYNTVETFYICSVLDSWLPGTRNYLGAFYKPACAIHYNTRLWEAAVLINSKNGALFYVFLKHLQIFNVMIDLWAHIRE